MYHRLEIGPVSQRKLPGLDRWSSTSSLTNIHWCTWYHYLREFSKLAAIYSSRLFFSQNNQARGFKFPANTYFSQLCVTPHHPLSSLGPAACSYYTRIRRRIHTTPRGKHMVEPTPWAKPKVTVYSNCSTTPLSPIYWFTPWEQVSSRSPATCTPAYMCKSHVLWNKYLAFMLHTWTGKFIFKC